MNAAEINRSFDLLALAGAEARLRRSGAYFVGPCPFCGGTDRFCVKLTPGGQRWFCRKCGDGKYHTAIDYVMRRDGLPFTEVLAVLGGQRSAAAAPRRRAAAPRPGISLPDAAWQADALRDAEAASARLLTGDDPAGRDYLSRRGLGRGNWLAWGLGYASVYDPAAKHARPAIVLPWVDSDPDQDAITAVKYRFIDAEAGGLRYVSRRGSVPLLYGLWAAVPGHHTLLLVEGEFNALSVWQCMPQGVTCLSFGSETGGRPRPRSRLRLGR
jgi:DNA primase